MCAHKLYFYSLHQLLLNKVHKNDKSSSTHTHRDTCRCCHHPTQNLRQLWIQVGWWQEFPSFACNNDKPSVQIYHFSFLDHEVTSCAMPRDLQESVFEGRILPGCFHHIAGDVKHPLQYMFFSYLLGRFAFLSAHLSLSSSQGFAVSAVIWSLMKLNSGGKHLQNHCHPQHQRNHLLSFT